MARTDKSGAIIFDTEAELLAQSALAIGAQAGTLAQAIDTGRLFYLADPSGPTWVPIAGQTGFSRALDLDFTSAPSTDFLPGGDGQFAFEGLQWDVANTGLASVFRNVNGTGFELTRTSGAAQVGPFFSLPLYLGPVATPTRQVPGWNVGRRWRITVRFGLSGGALLRLGLTSGPADNWINSGRRVGVSYSGAGATAILDGISPAFEGGNSLPGANVAALECSGDGYDYSLRAGEWLPPSPAVPADPRSLLQAARSRMASTEVGVPPAIIDDDLNINLTDRGSAQSFRLAFGTDGNGTLTVERIVVESEGG